MLNSNIIFLDLNNIHIYIHTYVCTPDIIQNHTRKYSETVIAHHATNLEKTASGMHDYGSGHGSSGCHIHPKIKHDYKDTIPKHVCL